jgi:hypothetical protein
MFARVSVPGEAVSREEDDMARARLHAEDGVSAVAKRVLG